MAQNLPETLNYQERELLLSQPNQKAPTGLRDLAMIRLMINAGLRSCEVLKMFIEDMVE